MDWQEKMIQEIMESLDKLYYEDFVFMHKFITEFAQKKHIPQDDKV